MTKIPVWRRISNAMIRQMLRDKAKEAKHANARPSQA